MTDTVAQLSLFGRPAGRHLVRSFLGFHAANPHVYGLFCRFADQLATTRRANYSARTVIHRIRWHIDVETEAPDGFKINNNFSPFYARLWMVENPEREGFFRLRDSAADTDGWLEQAQRGDT